MNIKNLRRRFDVEREVSENSIIQRRKGSSNKDPLYIWWARKSWTYFWWKQEKVTLKIYSHTGVIPERSERNTFAEDNELC